MDRDVKELIDGSRYGASIKAIVKQAEREGIDVSIVRGPARGGEATFSFFKPSFGGGGRGAAVTVDLVEDLFYAEGFDIIDIYQAPIEKGASLVEVKIMIDTPDIQDWLNG